jgi:hypothetical protein
MLDPTMVVAASGSHLRLYDTAWSEQVVACSRVARRPCESNRWMLEKDGSPRQGCVLRIRLARFARQRSPCLDLVTNRNRLASQLLVPSLTKADNGTLANDRSTSVFGATSRNVASQWETGPIRVSSSGLEQRRDLASYHFGAV